MKLFRDVTCVCRVEDATEEREVQGSPKVGAHFLANIPGRLLSKLASSFAFTSFAPHTLFGGSRYYICEALIPSSCI